MAPILEHPDVLRMLMTMKALTQAARVICYMTADSIDRAHRLDDPAARQAASERAGLLTPVAKAFSKAGLTKWVSPWNRLKYVSAPSANPVSMMGLRPIFGMVISPATTTWLDLTRV